MDDITILRGRSRGQVWRVYYYQGNFFLPMEFWGKPGKVRAAINVFKQKNKEMIARDRSQDNYKNLLQLFDE